MQVTTTQLNHKTKRDDSVDLSRYFVLFIIALSLGFSGWRIKILAALLYT
jgi:hypothetical protein